MRLLSSPSQEIHDRDTDILDFVELRRSKRAKRLSLRLDSKDRVMRLIVPTHMSERRAWAFAERHYEWIENQLSTLPTSIPFEHGQSIPVFGKLYDIVIDYDDSIKRTTIKLKDGQLYVHTNQEDPTMRITRYLKKQAKGILENLSHEKALRIGEKVYNVSVRDTKSRWGSCSIEGSISYSWRLIFAPYEAMDYVVAHEVAHLKHMDHSRAFWTCCASICDDYEEGKYWMREHGKELMAFG